MPKALNVGSLYFRFTWTFLSERACIRKSVYHVINHISQVIAVESCVIHPILRYGGTTTNVGGEFGDR